MEIPEEIIYRLAYRCRWSPSIIADLYFDDVAKFLEYTLDDMKGDVNG